MNKAKGDTDPADRHLSSVPLTTEVEVHITDVSFLHLTQYSNLLKKYMTGHTLS